MEKDVFYTARFEILAKHFLKEFSDLEPKLSHIFKLDFEQVRESFVSIFSVEDDVIPTRELEFFIFVCREYLQIEREPYQELLNLHEQIASDLRQISQNIAKCEKEKLKIEQNNDHKPKSINPIVLDLEAVAEERHSRQYVLTYYINRNLKAREDIFEYLASERIKLDAYKRSVEDRYGIFRQPLYAYQSLWDLYDIDSFSILSNKFLSLPPNEHRDLKNKFYSDTFSFLDFANRYILSEGVLKQLRNKIHANHRLYKRRKVLSFALDCFESNRRDVFIHLAGIQVEGLFYDYCLDMGFSKEQMNSLHSIERKLDELQKIDPGFLDLAYYMFEFPIIRNRIAHGKIVSDDEVNVWSIILILDLLDIFNRITSEELSINRLLHAATQAFESNQNDELLVALLLPLISPLKDMDEILAFYVEQRKPDSLNLKGRSEDFMKYLQKLISLDGYPILFIGIEKVLNSLKKDDPEKDKYKNLFRLLQKKKPFSEKTKRKLEEDFTSFIKQLDDASF